MLPVLFHIVLPAGFGKPVAVLAVIAVAVLRAAAAVRRGRREGEKVSLAEVLKEDAVTVVLLLAVVVGLWRAGILDGELRLPLHTYGLLIASAFLVGIWLAQREAVRRGQDAERV